MSDEWPDNSNKQTNKQNAWKQNNTTYPATGRDNDGRRVDSTSEASNVDHHPSARAGSIGNVLGDHGSAVLPRDREQGLRGTRIRGVDEGRHFGDQTRHGDGRGGGEHSGGRRDGDGGRVGAGAGVSRDNDGEHDERVGRDGIGGQCDLQRLGVNLA